MKKETLLIVVVTLVAGSDLVRQDLEFLRTHPPVQK